MKNEKYILLNDDIIMIKNTKLKRIQAIRDFGDVRTGDLGGYVQSMANLNFRGSAWIYDNAKVYGNASIRDRAKVKQNAMIYDRAIISDSAVVSGDSKVYGDAIIQANAYVDKNSRVTGRAIITGDATVTENSHIHGSAHISDQTLVKGKSLIYGRARIRNTAIIKNMALSDGIIEYSIKDDNFSNFVFIHALRKEITAIKTASDVIMLNVGGHTISLKELLSDINNDLLPDDLKHVSDKLRNTLLYLEIVLA